MLRLLLYNNISDICIYICIPTHNSIHNIFVNDIAGKIILVLMIDRLHMCDIVNTISASNIPNCTHIFDQGNLPPSASKSGLYWYHSIGDLHNEVGIK